MDARPSLRLLLPAAVAIGVADALLFLGFEWLVKHGTDALWNDLVDSDAVRWRVVPLALVLSVLFSLVVRLLRQPRLIEPHTDPLGGSGDAEDPPELPRETLSSIAVIVAVGLASLIAGAALGPEAPLVAATSAIGALLAGRVAPGPAGRLLVLASVGALLVAFFGSLVTLLVPVLVLWQRTRKLAPGPLLIVALAGLAAYATLFAVQGNGHGYGGLPDTLGVEAHDYAIALVLGALCVPIGALLRAAVARLFALTQVIDRRSSWWLSAAVFGAVLGVLYLVGGQSVQFSGSEGSAILVERAGDDGALALLGILVVKLLAAAWSLAAGYRGGLVFPSVFLGLALSLLIGELAGGLGGPGATIGAIGGILVEMTLPVVGVVMLLALLPLKLLGLGVAGAAGAVLGRRLFDRVVPGAQAKA
jgi:H+/Cl- antiporter ClcA